MTIRTVLFVGITLVCQSSKARAAGLMAWTRGAPFSDTEANHVIPCGPKGFLVSWVGWSEKKRAGDYFRVSRIQFLDEQGRARFIGSTRPTVLRDMVCHGNRFASINWDGELSVWDLESGTRLWKVASPDQDKDWKGRIAASLDGSFFVSAAFSDADKPLLVVRAMSWNGHTLWKRRLDVVHRVSKMTALFETKTGSWRIGLDNSLFSFVPNDKKIRRQTLPEKTLAAVAWDDQGVLAAGPFGLIGLSSGKQIWKLNKPAHIQTIAVAGQGRVVVVGQNGLVFSLDLEKGRVRWMKVLGRLDSYTTFEKYMGRNHRGIPMKRSERVVHVTQNSVVGRPSKTGETWCSSRWTKERSRWTEERSWLSSTEIDSIFPWRISPIWSKRLAGG